MLACWYASMNVYLHNSRPKPRLDLDVYLHTCITACLLEYLFIYLLAYFLLYLLYISTCIIAYFLLLTGHSWHATLDMSLLTCQSWLTTSDSSLLELFTCNSWLITHNLSHLTGHSLFVTLTCHSWPVTLVLAILTCHSWHIILDSWPVTGPYKTIQSSCKSFTRFLVDRLTYIQ